MAAPSRIARAADGDVGAVHAKMTSAATAFHLPPTVPLRRFAGVGYCGTWALWVWMRLIAALPLSASLAIHRGLGRALFHLSKRRRQIVYRNLEICFPELEDQARWTLARRAFESLGASFAESSSAWFAPYRLRRDRYRIVGLEHVLRALEHGKGVILYTGHFTPLEICGRPLKALIPRFACMFSRRSNKLLEQIQLRGRMRIAHELIPSDNIRLLLKCLRGNAAVWYAPDQADVANGELLPFFDEPAMTSTATARIARISGATVIPFSYRRLPGELRYELVFHAPPADLPSGDCVADTRQLVHELEQFIRQSPEQYLWMHRRFKGRPAGFGDPYAAPAAPRG